MRVGAHLRFSTASHSSCCEEEAFSHGACHLAQPLPSPVFSSEKMGGGVVFDIPQGFMVRVPPTRARPLGEMDENTPCLVTPPLHRVRPRVGGLQVVGREEKTPENVGAALESNQSSSNGGSAPGSLCDLQQVALPLCTSTAPSGKCRPCSAYLTGLF